MGLYAELYDFKRAYALNERSSERADILRKSPALTYSALEMKSMAEVNLMENKFDLGRVDEAWDHLTRYEKESDHPDYDFARDRWTLRMNDLKATILLGRGDVDGAEALARQGLETAAKREWKKYIGKAERMLGRTSAACGAFDRSEDHMRIALAGLEEVGNPKQRWMTHTALAGLYQQMNRPDLEREQWQAARAIVESTADALEDRALRQIFVTAAPVQEILENASR